MQTAINNRNDAQALVNSSGILNQNWLEGRNKETVTNQLTDYVFQNNAKYETFNEAVKGFIKEVLHDDPSKFTLQ